MKGTRQQQELDGELLDRLEELAVWLDENAPVGHSTPWLVRRDLVREAGRQLAASVSHQPVDAPIAPVVVNSQQEPPKESTMRECNLGCGYQFHEGFERCLHQRTREQSYHMLSPSALVGIQNDARLKAVWARQIALAGTPFQEGNSAAERQQEPPKELRERLAALAHEQWSGWMRYLFGRCYFTPDGAAFMEVPDTKRWQRQMNAPYAELPEAEKESDRKEADRVLALLLAADSHQQEPPQEPVLRQALKEIRYICRDVELGNWFAPDAIEHIIVACESVDDQPAAEGSQPVLRRDPCGCLHDGSRIVEWCTRHTDQQEPEQGWKPIESLPTDDSGPVFVLLWAPGVRVTEAYWNGSAYVPSLQTHDLWKFTPTHWRVPCESPAEILRRGQTHEGHEERNKETL